MASLRTEAGSAFRRGPTVDGLTLVLTTVSSIQYLPRPNGCGPDRHWLTRRAGRSLFPTVHGDWWTRPARSDSHQRSYNWPSEWMRSDVQFSAGRIGPAAHSVLGGTARDLTEA